MCSCLFWHGSSIGGLFQFFFLSLQRVHVCNFMLFKCFVCLQIINNKRPLVLSRKTKIAKLFLGLCIWKVYITSVFNAEFKIPLRWQQEVSFKLGIWCISLNNLCANYVFFYYSYLLSVVWLYVKNVLDSLQQS